MGLQSSRLRAAAGTPTVPPPQSKPLFLLTAPQTTRLRPGTDPLGPRWGPEGPDLGRGRAAGHPAQPGRPAAKGRRHHRDGPPPATSRPPGRRQPRGTRRHPCPRVRRCACGVRESSPPPARPARSGGAAGGGGGEGHGGGGRRGERGEPPRPPPGEAAQAQGPGTTCCSPSFLLSPCSFLKLFTYFCTFIYLAN